MALIKELVIYPAKEIHIGKETIKDFLMCISPQVYA